MAASKQNDWGEPVDADADQRDRLEGCLIMGNLPTPPWCQLIGCYPAGDEAEEQAGEDVLGRKTSR